MITYKVGGTQPLELGEAVEGDGEPMLFSTHSGTGKRYASCQHTYNVQALFVVGYSLMKIS